MTVRPFATLLTTALALAALPGCQQVTEIVVWMDTDLEVPYEADAISLEVSYDPQGQPQQVAASTWQVDPQGPHAVDLPATMGLLPGEDPLRLMEIRVAAHRSGRELMDRRAQLTFASDRVLLLKMFLPRACRAIKCPEGQTCGEGGCEPILISASELPDYDPGGADPGPDNEPGSDLQTPVESP
jgi:hypothetical protein